MGSFLRRHCGVSCVSVCIPALAIMYGDMSNATAMAMEETKKMRELRAKIMLQMQGE
jgi:hypothetical protein